MRGSSIRKTIVYASLLFVSFEGGSLLASDSERSPAYTLLRRTQTFAVHYVGYAAETSREVIAFRELLASPEADRLFKELLRDGHTAGKLYALCGLYWTDRAMFDAKIARWTESGKIVSVFAGCIISDSPVNRIVASTHANTLRLSGPDDTPEEWAKRQLDWDEYDYPTLDIIGGGYPYYFRGEAKAHDRISAKSIDWHTALESAAEGDDAVLERAVDSWDAPAPRELVEALGDARPEIRSAAVLALRQLDVRAAPAATALARLAADPEELARVEALETLVMLGPWGRDGWDLLAPAFRALPAAFDAEDLDGETFDSLAIECLASCVANCAPGSLKDTADLLAHPNPLVRTATLDGVYLLGDEASDIRSEIKSSLQDPDASVRAAAVRALAVAAENDTSTESLLATRLLEDRSQLVRATAAQGIGWLPGRVRGSFGARALRKATTTDASLIVCSFALASSWPVEGKAPEAVEVWLAARELKSESNVGYADDDGSEVDENSFYALEELRRSAPDIVAEVVVESGRLVADTVRELLDVIHDRAERPATRVAAIRLLGRIGPPAEAALDTLRNVSPSESLEFALAAAEAIWDIAGDPDTALEIHRGRFLSGVGTEATRALNAPRRYGKRGAAAAEWLVRALASENPSYQSAAATTLAAVASPECVPWVPAILEHLQRQPKPLLRALAAIGPDAREFGAIAAIDPFRNAEVAAIRRAAREAIERISNEP